MNKRILSVLFIGLLSLGCGEDDPTKDNNGSDNNTKTTNNDGKTTNNDKSTNNKMTVANNDKKTNNGTATNNKTTTPVQECGVTIDYYGQIASTNGIGGGVPAEEALTDDAGLDELYNFLNAPDLSKATVTDTLQDANDATSIVGNTYTFNEPIQITQAVVIAGWNAQNRVFWLEDQKHAIPVRLPDKHTQFTVQLKVGDAVTFKVNQLATFNGTPQIAEVSELTVDSSGNKISVVERTGMELSEADLYKTVRVQGIIEEGTGPCGGSYVCFNMKHGDKTVVYRSQSTFDEIGDCITFTGPLGLFPGQYKRGEDGNLEVQAFDLADLQLSGDNFDWARGPFKD